MERIFQRDNLFLLKTDNTACLLMINRHGHVELLHYGAAVELSDWEALRYKRTMPYGSEVLYTPEDETYCLDNVPLAWSGMGKGDYRITPIEAEMPDGSYTSDFAFERFELIEGACPIKSLPSAYGEGKEGVETLALYLKDKVYAVSLTLFFTVYGPENVITRRAVLENGEEQPVRLRRMMSMLADLPNKDFRMITLDGDWIAEANRHDRALAPGCFVNESTTGNSSNRHNPGVMLAEAGTNEDTGGVYGFNLVYSGNHYTAVELSSRNMVRVVSGVNPLGFNWTLQKGEAFETPEAVMTYSGQGFNGMSCNFHRFVQRHIVRGEWQNKERPVLLNNWEAHFFHFTRRKLIRFARRGKKLGVELFVLDDGWFGNRNSDKAGLGDYCVNLKKLPGGLEKLAEAVNKTGLDFGLWVEPESVNIDSDLYRAHPEYAVKLPNRAPSFGRNQLLLDLTKQQVRDYIVENVGRVLDGARISYVKWDMNRHMSDAYSDSCRAGEFSHRYIMGLYEVLARIFRPRPHILLESCASGGNRFDLGMLCFSPQIWASDDTDPIERLRIQRGLSYFYPTGTMGAHVSQSPHQQTLRATPLATRFNVAAFGALGYELDFGELSPAEKKQIREQIAFYKRYRSVFQFGQFYRYGEPEGRKQTLLCVSKGRDRAVLSMVQAQAVAGDSNDLMRVKGLEQSAEYLLETVPQRVAIGRFGGLLKHILPVKLRADGAILTFINRHFTLPDGKLRVRATGSALLAGVGLNNQFIGTGYHRDLRLWGDFGSQMYTVSKTEKNNEEDAV